MRLRSASARIIGTAFLLAGLAALRSLPASADTPIDAHPPSSAHTLDVSMEGYRAHLASLIPVVQDCAKYRDLPHCDPKLVGPDNRVPIVENGHETERVIRLGWLRVLLFQALVIDAPVPKPAQKPGQAIQQTPQNTADEPPATGDLLNDAVGRLNADLVQAGGKPISVSPHPSERATMRHVLSGAEFSHLNRRTMRDTMLEKLNEWLNRLFARLAGSRSQSPWVGRIIFWSFILLVCIGLAWGLLQLERHWRIRLVPESLIPANGAASARDWQFWLEDAHRAAASGLWREAIHFVYWAAISRLESRRLWPADRTRTPREYLALVSPEDPRKEGLAALTHNFEHTWYGGRPADEVDYRKTEELASLLINTGSAGLKGGNS